MKKIKLNLLFLVAVLFVNNAVIAQDENKETKEEGSSLEELSKKIANPLAQIWNLSFQQNFVTLEGDILDGNEHISTTLFQPVLPIPINDEWTAFARPVITFYNAPTNGVISGGSPINPIVSGTDTKFKLGDMILPMGVGKAKAEGWSWGGGLTFIFPTSSNDLLGSHKYQMGPTALLLWGNKDWMIGGHFQHWWSIGNDGASSNDPIIEAIIQNKHNSSTNHSALQYFIVRHLPNAWQVRASPIISANWEADSDNKFTLPLAIGVGKMIKLGPLPVMLMAEYQKAVVSPDVIGMDYTIMLQANFIIPNPFGSL